MPVDMITTEVEKTCSTCQEQYPADRADGLRSVCKGRLGLFDVDYQESGR